MSHYISDTKFLPVLAKKNLLQWPWRKQLNETASTLFAMIADSSRLHTSWGLRPSLRADEEFGEAMALASSVFESAKVAITLIACCSVLLEKKGDDRAAQALTLLQNKRETLPKAMVVELDKVAQTAAKGTTAKGRRARRRRRRRRRIRSERSAVRLPFGRLALYMCLYIQTRWPTDGDCTYIHHAIYI